MERLKVLGLGPGSVDFITPAVVKALGKSDIIIGGKRNLEALAGIESLDLSGKVLKEITGKLNDMTEFILNRIAIKTISVVASGDPGFYGILATLNKVFEPDQLEVIPGISSVQYMFSKLSMPWQDAYMGSLHGREDDVAKRVKNNKASVFLTDGNKSYKYIAQILSENGMGGRMMHMGNRLSYDDEIIRSMKAEDFLVEELDAELCVVVVEGE